MPQKLQKIFYGNITSFISFITRKEEVENKMKLILFHYFCVTREVEIWNSFRKHFLFTQSS